MRKKVIITGGHTTPAIVLINKIKKETDWQIIYLGNKYPFNNKTATSYEYETIKKIPGVKFVPLTAGKIPRHFSLGFFYWLAKIPQGFWQSFQLIKKTNPNLIISFGGYLSTPAVISAWLMGIPSVTHEQTSTVGLASRINAIFAKKVLITFPQTKKHLPRKKTIVSGNVIRKEIFQPKKEKRLHFLEKEKKPIIYITGGKTGSLFINNLIIPILPQLTKQYRLIHQAGRLDYKKFIQVKKRLKTSSYFVADFFSANEVGWILKHSRLVVSRSGANIICELVLTKKPAILIPLPNTSQDEQEKNAIFLKSVGLAKILNQKTASPTKLLATIKKIINNPRQYSLKSSGVTAKLIDKRARKFFQVIEKTIK